jgi:hypothetical protein
MTYWKSRSIDPLDLRLTQGIDLYRAMDWLLPRQARIEQAPARRHLRDASLALYDVASTYFEGRCCPLARYGYSRDGQRDKLQITFALLTNADGCPVAVEVFEGNRADPSTLRSLITKLRERFALKRIVLVGGRGMLTSARIRDELVDSGLEWLTAALHAPQIQQLLEGGTLQLSPFDERDLAEITDPAYPDERLVACRNPWLAEEPARKRNELLAATERASNLELTRFGGVCLGRKGREKKDAENPCTVPSGVPAADSRVGASGAVNQRAGAGV